MQVEISIDRRPTALENKDMINEDVSGSIHQGHERYILVMTLEEDEIFMCLAALLCE